MVIVLAAVLALSPLLTNWFHRRRFRTFRGVEIHGVDTPRLYRGQFRQAMRSEALWRQALYHLIAGPLIGLAGRRPWPSWTCSRSSWRSSSPQHAWRC